MHWLTVIGALVAFPVMVLVTCTVHSRVAPPPRAEPLHWLTVVVSTSMGVVVQITAPPAAPWHACSVLVELLTPVARLSRFWMMTWHSTAWPPPL